MSIAALDLKKDPVAALARALSSRLRAARLPVCSMDEMAAVLKTLLDGDDEASRKLRLAMSIHLVEVANRSARKDPGQSDPMLTTEEAAKLMGRSRPWVVMLIDSNELEGAVVSQGGHRKVPKSSVLQWMARNNTEADFGADYRKAGHEAGIYEIGDAEVIKALRESSK
jgi:excisionase family DNA binding protein